MIYQIDERNDIERQLICNLCLEIACGKYRPGDRAPTEEALAHSLLINPRVVAITYERLKEAGLFEEIDEHNFRLRSAAPERAREFLKIHYRSELRKIADRLINAGLTHSEIQDLFQEVMAARKG